MLCAHFFRGHNMSTRKDATDKPGLNSYDRLFALRVISDSYASSANWLIKNRSIDGPFKETYIDCVPIGCLELISIGFANCVIANILI